MAAVLRSAALSAIFSHWSVCVVGQAAAAGIWLAGMRCDGRGGLARSRRSPSTWTTHLCVSEAKREQRLSFAVLGEDAPAWTMADSSSATARRARPTPPPPPPPTSSPSPRPQ